MSFFLRNVINERPQSASSEFKQCFLVKTNVADIKDEKIEQNNEIVRKMPLSQICGKTWQLSNSITVGGGEKGCTNSLILWKFLNLL